MQKNPTTDEKKPKREGQIIKRGKERFLVRVYLYRDSNGKRIYYSAMIKGSKKDAEQHLIDYLQKKHSGTLKQRPSDKRLEEFALDYLINISNTRRRNKEIDIYKLKRYIIPHIGHLK